MVENKNLDILKKYWHWMILLALIIPIVFISILSVIIKLGTILINTSILIIDINKPISIGDYLGYYVSIVSIVITAIFSYALLNTSIKSNELSEAIKNKEEKRDREAVRESALIVYYDLISNLSILKRMYFSKNFKSIKMEENKLNVVSDWVKNVANLRDILTRKELEIIYSLYNSFLLLNELYNNAGEGIEEINTLVKSLSEKIFISALLDYLWMDFEGVIESTLNSRYYIILRKIELASKISYEKDIPNSKNGEVIVKQNNGSVKYEGILKEGILYEGIDSWYRDNGELSYFFEYENGEIISGKYINIFRDKYELIFDGQFNHSNNLVNGYITLFYNSNKINYQGSIKDSIFDGEGRLYSKKNSLSPLFSGIWKEGNKISGEYKSNNSNGIIYFKGEYHRDEPYSGEIKCGDLYKLNDSYGFKGIIKEGKIVEGKGYKFLRNIVSEEYQNQNPFYDFDMEKYDECDEYDEYDEYDNEDLNPDIPDEVQEEIAKDSARAQIQDDLDYMERKYGHVVELIGAEWIDGESILYENDLLNKMHFYYLNSEKTPGKS